MEARFLEEAARLTSLDAKGRNLEALAIALRQGEESEKTARRLNEMDLEFLDWWRGGNDFGRSSEVGADRESR